MNVTRLDKKDKIGEILLIGEQTGKSAERTLNASIKIDAEQSQLYGRVVTLIDMTQIGSFTIEALNVSVRSVSGINFDRVAVLNAPEAARIGLVPAIKLAGRDDHVRFFSDRNKAVAWLQEVPTQDVS